MRRSTSTRCGRTPSDSDRSRQARSRLLPSGARRWSSREVGAVLGLLLFLLVLALLFGGYGHSRDWGYYGWSPLGLLILIILIFWFVGLVRAEEVGAMAIGS